MTLSTLGSVVKPAIEILRKCVSTARKGNRSEEDAKFEHGKQQLLMELVTASRKFNTTQLGFSAEPGTQVFAYSEALVRDGFLERDIRTGRYYIKTGSGRGSDGAGLY